MDEVLRLVAVLAEAATARRRPAGGHLVGVMLALALAGMCMAVAVGCALAALWLAAVPWVGPAGAPLVVAGVMLAAGLIALAVASRLRQPPPAPPKVDATSLVLAALMAGVAAGTRGK
jgi:hypothetical protein